MMLLVATPIPSVHVFSTQTNEGIPMKVIYHKFSNEKRIQFLTDLSFIKSGGEGRERRGGGVVEIFLNMS